MTSSDSDLIALAYDESDTDSDHSEDLIESHILQKARNRTQSKRKKDKSRSKDTKTTSNEQVRSAPSEERLETSELPTQEEPRASTSTRPQQQQPVGVIVVADDQAHDSAQMVQQLLRRSRYFDEEYEQAGIRCNNCGEKGHMAKDCRNEKRRKPCFLCAQAGHESWNCPNRYCFKCGKTGHFVRDCTAANSYGLAQVCLRCGREDCSSAGKGDAFRSEGGCTKDYLESDMRRVRCYVCHKLGHLCCKPAPQEAAQMSCYNCGADDHWGEQCGLAGTAQVEQERKAEARRAMADRWGGPSYPRAAAYDLSGGFRDFGGYQDGGGYRDRGRQVAVERWDSLNTSEPLFTMGSNQGSRRGDRHQGRKKSRY